MIDVNTLLQVANTQRELLEVKQRSLEEDYSELCRMKNEALDDIIRMFDGLIVMKQRELNEIASALGVTVNVQSPV